MCVIVYLFAGRAVAVYACGCDDVECGCGCVAVVNGVDERVIVGGDGCCCVCDCDVDKLGECRCDVVDVAGDTRSHCINVQLFCL